MSAKGKWLMAVAAMALASGQVWAGAGGSDTNAVLKVAAWDRVGEGARTVNPVVATPGRTRTAEALQARKAEMVRRMFWIMLAHR